MYKISAEYDKLRKNKKGQVAMEYSFVIRRAEPADAPAVKDIMMRAFEKYRTDTGITSDVAALSETLEEIEEEIRTQYVFIAMVDSVPVGSLRIAFQTEDTAYLTRFGVRSDYSNMGIGKSLMGLADKLMLEKKIKKLKLHTASTYLELVRFYYGRGFYIDSTNKDRGYIRALLVKEYFY